MWEGLLPIGSVIQLKDVGDKQNIMIVGLCAIEPEETGVIYDYTGVLHPYGFVDEVYVFDRDKIEKVVSVGYMDEEQFAVYDRVNDVLAKVRAGEMTIEDLINARPPKPEFEREDN